MPSSSLALCPQTHCGKALTALHSGISRLMKDALMQQEKQHCGQYPIKTHSRFMPFP